MRRFTFMLMMLLVATLNACTLGVDFFDEMVTGPRPTPTPVVIVVTAIPPPTATPVPTPTPITCVVRTDWPVYTVVAGDTLYRIAQRVGSTVNDLAVANCLTDPTVLYVGQALRVPTLPAPPPPPTLPPPPSPTLPDCDTPPAPVFNQVYTNNPDLATALGCPNSYHPRVVPQAYTVDSAIEHFEHGAMIWVSQLSWYQQKMIYVFYDAGWYARYGDHWDESQPVSGGETPPPGLVEPVRGFGKIWREQNLRNTLGWATDQEQYGQAQIQTFTGGEMIYLPQTGPTFIFVSSSQTWYVRY